GRRAAGAGDQGGVAQDGGADGEGDVAGGEEPGGGLGDDGGQGGRLADDDRRGRGLHADDIGDQRVDRQVGSGGSGDVVAVPLVNGHQDVRGGRGGQAVDGEGGRAGRDAG